ncbi:DUF7619 domain-containing protein [Winogradskyella vidalii]|uniref:DUF7619 domain-containing protein n=1 Tax=Winogradskyella vidalii TaxID=2615024 RepID=UPI0015C6A22D|nr:leucine-rich repeat domain-containing protein [Winogradskyella vidalii]
MKQFYLIFLLVTTLCLQAQTVNIPDNRFKSMVVNDFIANYDGSSGFSFKVDTNGDGEIQISEAEAVIGLYLGNIGNDIKISDLEGLQYFINLKYLNIENNDITTIDTDVFPELETLYVTNNLLTELDVSANNNLITLNCQFNQISNLTPNPNIEYLYCSTNEITTLDITNNSNLIELGCSGNLLSSLDISNNTNLTFLVCAGNQFTDLDLSNNIMLEELVCNSNQLSTLDTSNLINLSLFWCGYNELTAIDVSNNLNLTSFNCQNNQLTSLDISNNQHIEYFNFNDNPELIYLNEKNGVPTQAEFGSGNNYNGAFCPNLQYICADDDEIEQLANYHGAYNSFYNVNSYCSFVPGGEFYTVSGYQKLDSNNNGCDSEDIIFPNLKYNITDGTTSGSIISDNTGNYNINVQAGTHTISPLIENPDYFNISPTSITVDFPSETSPYSQNFCITPNGIYNDLEIVILPLEVARPGFDTAYKIVFKNKGNTTLSGTIDLTFNADYMAVLDTSPMANLQTTGSLQWDFQDLMPCESRDVLYTMTLNTPTDSNFPLNDGDILNFTATINSAATDETPADNTIEFKQDVVNSYDPNDKTCLEGKTITPDQVGQFIHYLIRFENLGTANAVNVVVKDFIDITKFDISSLIPLGASHDFYTRILNDDEVEFVFENIELPFNDAHNDGYILFKIQSLPTLDVGESISNIAGIYFDYNYPIITNDEITTIQNNLSISEFNHSKINLYPNPVANYFIIESLSETNIISVDMYDVKGRQIKQYSPSETYSMLNFPAGIYFLNITTNYNTIIKKIIKL